MKYMRPSYLKSMVDAAVEDSGIDIALHLDHGDSLELVKKCIDVGFTSVMFDGSHYDMKKKMLDLQKK